MVNRADQRKFHYIYKITRIDGSGKYYIGMHSTDDLEDGYFGSGQRLWKSIKKHGKEKHTKEILEFLPTRFALREREKELVNEEILRDKQCMNIALGGGGPIESHGLLTSEKMKAKWTPERKEKQAARLREITKKRFENYWDTHLTRAEKLSVKRKAEGYKQPDRSALASAMWSRKTKTDLVKTTTKMSAATKGKIYMTSPAGQIKRIQPEELTSWISKGWVRGRTLTPSVESLRKRNF